VHAAYLAQAGLGGIPLACFDHTRQSRGRRLLWAAPRPRHPIPRGHLRRDRLVGRLWERQHNELLLGFPAAPFILPLAAEDVGRFLSYARDHPDHAIRLRRTGEASGAEWSVSPAAQEWADRSFTRPEGYRLTFNLPERLEAWISEHEEHRASRIRAVKAQFLSEVIIYRMENDNLQTFQLQYQPSDLRRVHH
jgi:hypothetical protein